jgi:hypothetical protein
MVPLIRTELLSLISIRTLVSSFWIPAFAGMTYVGDTTKPVTPAFAGVHFQFGQVYFFNCC